MVAWPSPWTTAPTSWPSTIVGLIARPTSHRTKCVSGWTWPVVTSTPTTERCTPNEPIARVVS